MKKVPHFFISLSGNAIENHITWKGAKNQQNRI